MKFTAKDGTVTWINPAKVHAVRSSGADKCRVWTGPGEHDFWALDAKAGDVVQAFNEMLVHARP